jgi:dCTP deaminase
VALEHLRLPADVTALFIGKSTYARCGVIANLTPGEAGWCGHLTLEFSNSSGADVRLYAEEGIVQALFFRGVPCLTSYETRRGKYQGQPEQVVTAIT